MIPFLIEQFKNNELLQAAVIAAPLASLSWAAKSVPMNTYHALKKFSSLEVSFNSDMPDYQEILNYVTEHVVYKKFSRNFSYHTDGRYDPVSDEYIANHKGLRLGYGVHWGFYKRRLVIVRRELEAGQQTEKFKERLFFTMFSFSMGLIEDFAKSVAAHVSKDFDDDYISLSVNARHGWMTSGRLPLRSMDSVFTSHGEKEKLLHHLEMFEQSRDSYRRKGVPWHTGALLTGPPGTGKTSIIQAIASKMGREIRYLNLAYQLDFWSAELERFNPSY
jgi:chaperone BCS1